jgi:hypothetical protein
MFQVSPSCRKHPTCKNATGVGANMNLQISPLATRSMSRPATHQTSYIIMQTSGANMLLTTSKVSPLATRSMFRPATHQTSFIIVLCLELFFPSLPSLLSGLWTIDPMKKRKPHAVSPRRRHVVNMLHRDSRAIHKF